MNHRTRTVSGVSALAAIAFLLASSTVNAGHSGYRHGVAGPAGPGLAAGAIVSGAIAASQSPYGYADYGYGPGYYGSGPDYSAGYSGYAYGGPYWQSCTYVGGPKSGDWSCR
jgi:hypothetical protein